MSQYPTSSSAVTRESSEMAESKRAVECIDVVKTYRRGKMSVLALNHVNLSVGLSEFVSVVGPSGCGKSTLLQLIAGLDNEFEGTVRTPPRGGKRQSAQIGMVFQRDALYPWMSILDNVAFSLRVAGVGRRERISSAQDMVEAVHLSAFGQAYPNELSGGMRQRANLARAFMGSPGLLLMDEPFAALDVQTRTLMQYLLLELWEKNKTSVLFITHSIEEAVLLSDRVLIMSASPGEIIKSIDIPFERPRDDESLRYDPQFAELCQRIWHVLRGEVLKANDIMESKR